MLPWDHEKIDHDDQMNFRGQAEAQPPAISSPQKKVIFPRSFTTQPLALGWERPPQSGTRHLLGNRRQNFSGDAPVRYPLSSLEKKMSEANVEVAKELDPVNNTPNHQADVDPSVEDAKQSDLNEENPMPSPQQEEETIKKKYGGMLPKKPTLISKDHEHVHFLILLIGHWESKDHRRPKDH
ncbi:hypothetical protein F0562_033798 [Nyssa sinensis]|uniref:Uncharacterized protein n=1 Tax=Nyssa sinensis TaxID=561372 RepID=A0A5J5AEI4_9ASTE|nr:hypothetical protein F0562_033798 [Nyssa sinensis]